MLTLFIAAAVGGLVFLIATAVFGEFEFGDVDGIPWLSLPAIAVGVTGFGAIGAALEYGLSLGSIPTLAIAVVTGVILYALVMVVLQSIRKSQGGSVALSTAYAGTVATVSMTIPAGGWGQITFLEPDGVRATRTAKLQVSSDTAEVGASVLIISTEGSHLVVDSINLPHTHSA